MTVCPNIEMAKILEFKLCLFVAGHNLPFSFLDHLNDLIKSSVPDSQIVKKFLINRHKGQKFITSVTGPENK